MCQLPLISMWVSNVSPPENRISSHLPADSIRSTVRPAIGVSTSTRSSFGSTDSNRVTTCPPIARCSVAAARNSVSPSGIQCFLWLHFTPLHQPPHLEPKRTGHKPRILQERRQEVIPRGRIIDLPDQQ